MNPIDHSLANTYRQRAHNAGNSGDAEGYRYWLAAAERQAKIDAPTPAPRPRRRNR